MPSKERRVRGGLIKERALGAKESSSLGEVVDLFHVEGHVSEGLSRREVLQAALHLLKAQPPVAVTTRGLRHVHAAKPLL